MNTTIGIVTISYNQAAYLRDCIESIVPQLVQGDHYVIVDPGSTDNSRCIIGDYIKAGVEVSALLECDRGPSDGLNKGFHFNNSDVLGYINSDDFILPGCLSFVRNYFDSNPDVDVLIGGIKIADSKGAFSVRKRFAELPDLEKFLTSGFLYYQQGTFIRKSAFLKTSGFVLSNKTCWDFELIIDLLLSGAIIRVVSEPLAAFRIHGDSITGKGENGVAHESTMELIRAKVRIRGYRSRGVFMKLYYLLERKLNLVRLLMQLI